MSGRGEGEEMKLELDWSLGGCWKGMGLTGRGVEEVPCRISRARSLCQLEILSIRREVGFRRYGIGNDMSIHSTLKISICRPRLLLLRRMEEMEV